MRTSVIDDHLSKVYKSIESNELNPEIDVVASSWKRCIETFKLDPLMRHGSRVVTQSELKNHTTPIEDFIATAREGMENLYAQVKSLDYVVMLCDKNGITVDYIGNERLTKDLRNSGLYLGADWNERHAGTCAVGTIINELVPLTIHQHDHFDIVNTTLTCSASPILNHNGELIAVLDVSALYSPKEKTSQHLLLKLVQMHAGLIEAANFLNYYSNSAILKFDTNSSSLETFCPNLIALDNYNVVIGANQNARKIMARELGINDITSPLLTGFDITSLFQLGTNPTKLNNVHFVIKSKNTGTQFFCYFQPQRTKNINTLLNQPKASSQYKTKPIAAEISKLAGIDPLMQKVKLLANKFAPTDINILIQGETGTGKEVLAEKVVTPIGSDQAIPVDFRLISATHQNISSQIESKQITFRPDLYHRLNGATISLPALRDRQDLKYLVSSIVSSKSGVCFSNEVMQVLTDYPWPGNIRELKNVISYALTLCDDEIINLEHLPEYVFSCTPFIFNENEGVHTEHAEILPEEGQNISNTLRHNNWNATETAKQLKISRATLYRKMKKYNIVSPNNTDSSL